MKRRASCLLVAASLAVTGLLLSAALASANPALKPVNLRVSGGAENWHASNNFRLDWDQPWDGSHYLPFAAVHIRVLDSAGATVLPEAEFPRSFGALSGIRVPGGPGRYTAEIWLEDAAGDTGPPVSAQLLFDDTVPGPTMPTGASGWIAGNAPAIVTLDHPPQPWPISGLRGYAISVDGNAEGAPCAGTLECTLAETDLGEGVGDDTISLGPLPEGLNFVHAVAVSGAGVRSAQATTTLRVDATDPEATLLAPSGWANGPVRVLALATDAHSGMAAAGGNGPYTAIAVDSGIPHIELGGSSATTVAGQGEHRVAFYARDAAGNVGEEMRRETVVRIDESPPRVAFTLNQDPAEPERIEAMVGDSLSGPSAGRGTIGIRPAGTHEPFAPLPTSVSAGKLVARWDSDAFATRSYEFRAIAYDAAGNVSTTERRANNARMVLANPVKTPTRVAAGFGGSSLAWQRCSRKQGHRRCRHVTIRPFEARPATRTVPYGRGVVYSGRLTLAAGAALAGLPVEVVESFGPGADPLRRTTITRTAADGGFEARLLPGPSRLVEAVFAGTRTLTRASGGAVELKTQAGVSLHASAATASVGGAPVSFRGRVGELGAPIPSQGRPVELQFRLGAGAWSEFRTVHADPQGRFRYRYSFSDDDSRGVRFHFRAFVPAQAGWPYEPGASRPIFVTGR